MPNGSVGGSIAQGLQTGFSMGRQIDADRAQTEQRAFDRERQTKQDARIEHAAELAASHQQLSASRERLGMLASQNAGLLQQYGGADKIPPEALGSYTQDMEAASKAHMGLLDKLAPRVADWRQQAENNASRMKAGELDPRTMAPADLVHTITGSTGQPIENYLPSPDGKPALVKQMANDFRVGMESQNEGLILKSINGLFSRELKAGVGQPSPHGGTILGKQIIKIVPAPTDPNNPEDPNAGKVTPVIRVFVREGGGGVGEQQRMASNEEQRYGAPPGATGHYDAPITKNRSSDPNDAVMHISMDEAMNRIGQMESLASAFEDPALLARAKQGITEAGDAPNKFLQAFYAVGGKAPTKIESYENIPLSKYGNLRITKNAQGVETKREMLGAPVEGSGAAAGPLGKKLADIAASDLTDDEKEKAKRVATGLVKVGTPKASGGTGLPEPSLDPKTVDFYATQSIAGDNSWQVGLARGKVGQQLISAVKDRIPKMAEELGLSPQDVGTNKATSVALGATLRDLTKRSEAVELFANKVEKDMKTFDSLLDGAAKDSPLLINKPLNALRRQFSDPKLAQLDLAAKQVAMEYERLITGGTLSVAQLHVGAAEDAKKLINGDMPPKQARAIMEIMHAEMKNAKESAHESRSRVQDQLRGLGKSTPPKGAKAAPNAPSVGTVQGGYKFKGGNPADPASWEKQ